MSYNKTYRYEIIDGLNMKIDISENRFLISPDKLFLPAARNNNKKRSFLFVSKLLGKHIPVDPSKSILTGHMLAGLYAESLGYQNIEFEDLKEALKTSEGTKELLKKETDIKFSLKNDTLFIGFAETATALGHSVFEKFDEKVSYIHTTRENIIDYNEPIKFEEEHSHATSHKVYPKQEVIIDDAKNIVFIDDEITTGNTILNIIKNIHQKWKKNRYSVLTILDWRSDRDKEKFKKLEKELDTKIDVISIMSGSCMVDGKVDLNFEYQKKELKSNLKVEKIYLDEIYDEVEQKASVDSTGMIKYDPYIVDTGRFGIKTKDQEKAENRAKKAAMYLTDKIINKRVLFMGTGEFMYIPMKIASYVKENVSYQSLTRSPIYPMNKEGYGAKNVFCISGVEDMGVDNYFYNIPTDEYDEIFIFFEREPYKKVERELKASFADMGIKKLNFVIHSKQEIGSYKEGEVNFLLKDLSERISEQGNEEREKLIQSGTHYSEMIPIEYKPSKEYMSIFEKTLNQYKLKIAEATALVSEKIKKYKGDEIVLVSLARAGTPAGILIKRYLEEKYNLEVSHYSVSIIRGKGIDENAMKHIVNNHGFENILFVDGWTGKGAITKELTKACDYLNSKYNWKIESKMAVIADPGHCSHLYGTREDFLLPSACLNSTVSGLVSRTIHRNDLIDEFDYHGVKFYSELKTEDVSRKFVDTVSTCFDKVVILREDIESWDIKNEEITFKGMEDVKGIQNNLNIKNIHFVKPGIGETTRVLLRRVPWKILVRKDAKNIEHILKLAEEKNILVEEYDLKAYECCGIIKPMECKEI